ncbi:MAG: peptidase M54 [Candidatus Eisenbacteria bacterium]|nr:peptidase M54 [Candidatus Eisenbacteria bacterium]
MTAEPPGQIWIAPMAELDPALLEYLSLVLADQFGGHPRFLPSIDPSVAYDVARGQTNAVRLLDVLSAALGQGLNGSGAAAPWHRVLGITDVDLFMPVLSFVFGQAQLGGEACLVSIHRLDDAVYGLPANPDLLLARFEKEVLHELGHTFGHRHCHQNGCVMRYSASVEEIDLKSARFCEGCTDQLRLQTSVARQPDRERATRGGN